MEIFNYIFAILAAGAVGILVMTLVKLMLSTKKTPAIDSYVNRDTNFKLNMDERQHQLNDGLRGASTVEVWMTFEARLYALEQRVIAAEKRNLDDGK